MHAYKRISSRCVQGNLYDHYIDDHYQVFFVFVLSEDVTSKIGKTCAERWQWHEQIFQVILSRMSVAGHVRKYFH